MEVHVLNHRVTGQLIQNTTLLLNVTIITITDVYNWYEPMALAITEPDHHYSFSAHEKQYAANLLSVLNGVLAKIYQQVFTEYNTNTQTQSAIILAYKLRLNH